MSMVNPDKYCILHGVNSFCNSQSREISEARAFWRTHFETINQEGTITDREIQLQLFDWYGTGEIPEQINSELCLRCFVSNCIYHFCLTTEQHYRESYGLSRNDLFPVLLEPIESTLTASQVNNSLSKEIIDTFDCEKNSSLSTWTKIKVKGNKRYKRVLKFYDIVEVTDWLILVNTTLGKLDRKLTDRGYSEFERREYVNLLEIFHQVYSSALFEERKRINEQRLQEGKRKTNKPYPPPTQEQLMEIAQLLDTPSLLEPQEILEKLRTIAQIIRNNNPSSNILFAKSNNPEPDNELVIFVQEQIEDNLFTVVNQVIQARIDLFLKKKKPQTEKANNFILILRLFHCEQYSMGEIATEINFTNQSKVSRLMKLKELREDVSRNAIALLKNVFTERLTAIINDPKQLSALDTKIQDFLEVEIQEIMNEAKKEALNSQRRTRNSLFSRVVCESVQQRINSDHE